ncbi:tetratricopeptide repeat protein [Lactiplantibacillus pentosus]
MLEYIINQYPNDGLAAYYLGNLFYDRKVYDRAIQLWEQCSQLTPKYAMAHRNLAIGYFNKQQKSQAALRELETAFELDPQNSRLVFELDTLYEKLAYPLKNRITFLEQHMNLVNQRDDSYISLVTLLNETGHHHKAYDLIMAHTFHPWEGGEGKVSTQYEYALVELAKKDLMDEHPRLAIEKLQQALTYPRSLGEGKLPIAVDNVIDYYLGLAYQQLGDNEAAKSYFNSATQGLSEPTDMMYYNDQPADTIFYQGLAYEQLQKMEDARAKYYKLINFGEQHLFDKFKMDYFAVSLPDALLFEEDYQTRNTVHCYYLMALGYLGLGNIEKSQKLFKKAGSLSNHHQGIIRHQNFVKINGNK